MALRPRLRFIVKEGMLRRGSIVGGIAAEIFAISSFGAGSVAGLWQFLFLIVLCFLEWTIGSGWLIGEWLWTRRGRRDQEANPLLATNRGVQQRSDDKWNH